jgi:hypothetical protein
MAKEAVMMTKMKTARRKFTDAVEAWAWLNGHPVFDFEAKEIVLSPKDKWLKAAGITKETRVWFQDNTFAEGLSIELVRVNPATKRIEGEALKNTQVEVWLEAGGPVESDGRRYRVSHDILLDCGGPTFEAALLQMAKAVLKHYGDYEAHEYAG